MRRFYCDLFQAQTIHEEVEDAEEGAKHVRFVTKINKESQCYFYLEPFQWPGYHITLLHFQHFKLF